MKKNILPYMIDTLRKEKQWTLEELGLKINKSKSAISRWIKGDRSPMIEDLEKLAILFDTDVHTLLYGKKTRAISKSTAHLIKTIKQLNEQEQFETLAFANQLLQNRMKQTTLSRVLFPIQVVEALAAGVGYSYGNNDVSTVYTDRDNLKMYDIASAVVGDSMEPLIHHGDVVLIQKDKPLINGNIYAIDYDEKSYVKKVYFGHNTLRLVSLNEKYDDIMISTNTSAYLNIVGLIVDWFTPVDDK